MLQIPNGFFCTDTCVVLYNYVDEVFLAINILWIESIMICIHCKHGSKKAIKDFKENYEEE